jgi:hypothetical protein
MILVLPELACSEVAAHHELIVWQKAPFQWQLILFRGLAPKMSPRTLFLRFFTKRAVVLLMKLSAFLMLALVKRRGHE